MDRVIGDLSQDPVDRHDQDIDAEYAGDPGERRRQPGQRVSPEAEESGRSERDQDQVAGIGGDARHDSQSHQNPGEGLARRDVHDLFDKRGHQTSLFGQADADHDDEDDGDRAEIREVPHHRSQHEADAIGGQQAIYGSGCFFNFVRLRIDYLISDGRSKPMEQM